MKKMHFIFLALLSGWIFTGCGYNTIVEMDEAATSQWSQVENVYQRRADLIPNLVATVKGYAEHEQETLTGVTEARSQASSVKIDPSNMTPENLQQFQQVQDGLTSALNRLMVVVERYPDLKANLGFLDLQAQLEGTENRITVERMKFNETTRQYNAYIRKFPVLVTARLFGFKSRTYFEALPEARTAPQVQF